MFGYKYNECIILVGDLGPTRDLKGGRGPITLNTLLVYPVLSSSFLFQYTTFINLVLLALEFGEERLMIVRKKMKHFDTK